MGLSLIILSLLSHCTPVPLCGLTLCAPFLCSLQMGAHVVCNAVAVTEDDEISTSLLCGPALVVSGFWDIMGTSASWCGSGWGPGRDPRGCYWPQTLSAKCHTGVLWSGDYSSSDSLISIRPTQLRQWDLTGMTVTSLSPDHVTRGLG